MARNKLKKKGILNIATWNVRVTAFKEDQLDDILAKKNIKIAAISETKKKFRGSKETHNYLQFYHGVGKKERAQTGVMLMIHKPLQSTIDSYTFWNERIIEVRLKISRGYITILGIYAPVEGREEENDQFYKLLQKIIDKVNKSDMVILMGDFNARTGNNKSTGNIGTFGVTTCNKNGVKLRDLVLYNDLKIRNTFFQHKDAHKYIWPARGSRSIIDHIICNQKTANLILDVSVYRGPETETDHYLVASPLRIPPRWYKRKQQIRNSDKIFKINLLRDPSIRWLFKNRVLTLLQQVKISSNIEEECANLTYLLKPAATESIGLRNK
jgi:exonuclease III